MHSTHVATVTLVCIALLISPAPANAEVQWTLTTRTVGSEVITTNATEFALNIDNESSASNGFFAATVSVDTMVTGVFGGSISEQESDLFDAGLTGSGGFQTSTEVNDPDGIVDAFGGSAFTGYFDLDEPTPYSLSAVLTTGGSGTTAEILLFGPGGAIVNVQASPETTLPVNESGTLDPGSYLVAVNVAGGARESQDIVIEASGEWEMTFVLDGATAAPTTAQAAGLRVFPNPARESTTISRVLPTGSPARLSIHDVTGRVVRTIDVTSDAATWDTRDSAGRPVPAGVYLIKVRVGERLATGRVIVLR